MCQLLERPQAASSCASMLLIFRRGRRIPSPRRRRASRPSSADSAIRSFMRATIGAARVRPLRDLFGCRHGGRVLVAARGRSPVTAVGRERFDGQNRGVDVRRNGDERRVRTTSVLRMCIPPAPEIGAVLDRADEPDRDAADQAGLDALPGVIDPRRAAGRVRRRRRSSPRRRCRPP